MGHWYDTVMHFLWLTCLNISQLNYTFISKGCCKLLFRTKSLPYLPMPALTSCPPRKAPQWLSLPFWPPMFYQRQFSGSAAPAFLKGLPAFTILSSLSQNTLDKPYSNSVLSVAVGDVPYQHLLLINLQSPLSVKHFSVHCYSTVSNIHHKLLADCNDTVKSQCNFMCSK